MICEITKKIKYDNALIVCDKNVGRIYRKVIDSQINFHTINGAGEKIKSHDCVTTLYETFSENSITRKSLIIAIGGGTVGDVVGFSASTYMRGINVVHVPTTLLSMVDSSIGGKTAINFNGIKNLIGSFHEANMTYINFNFLKSLKDDDFNDGIAEIIKYGLGFDKSIFNSLLKNKLSQKKLNQNTVDVIKKCIAIKKRIVKNDLFETGERKKLNLGHTFGHAIEKISNGKISHGKAVASGLLISLKVSNYFGYDVDGILKKTEELVKKYGLCIESIDIKKLLPAVKTDKKRNADSIDFILIKQLGECEIKKIEIKLLEKILRYV